MFERYTEASRRVIFQARYEASNSGSAFIETEHLLLGVLDVDHPLALQLFGSDGAVAALRAQVTTPEAATGFSSSRELPLSARENLRPYTGRAITRGLKIQVRNLTRDVELAAAAEVADTSAKRRTGLLKHTHLEPGDGLWIVPCESVHCFFMKFTIDVIYLDRKHRVKKVRPEMVPWRISACLTAHSVLELPAGTIARTGTEAGDQLEIKSLS